MTTRNAPESRPSLLERSLDVDERVKLQVLRSATEPTAPLYAAILSILVGAKERYEVQVRTEDLAAQLGEHDIEPTALTSALEQLKDWGAVTWTQDTSRVARIEDFHRRRELWQLTAAGQSAHDSMLAVLGAADEAGSLQRALFRDIRENLDALARAVDSGDATATYLRLRDLDGALRDLAANARDFHAAMAQLRRDQELVAERFLAYKHLLIDYLQQFLDDLFRYRAEIADKVAAIEQKGVDRLIDLAASGDDSAGLFLDRDLARRWAERWAGLTAWFRSDRRRGGAPAARAATTHDGAIEGTGSSARPTRASGPAGADELAAATTTAIRDLMAFLRRLTESSTRPITRASELLHLARWFVTLEPEGAHRLFDAAFGLAAPHHLGLEEPDPDLVTSSTSWWEAEPVEVPVSLRDYGRRAPAPPPAAATDFNSTKQHLAAEHHRRRGAHLDAAARLTARPLEGRSLTEPELALLLELLDRALHERPLDGPFKVEVETEGVRLIVATALEPTSVVTVAGTLTIDRTELEVHRS